MKKHCTLIMISVRAPSFMENEKMEAINKKIFTEVVVPFKCETRVHNSRSKYDKRILVFYIFKDGRLKNSVQTRLERTLDNMKKHWPTMINWHIDTISKKVNEAQN